MSHSQEHASSKRRDFNTAEGQDLASHDVGPTSPKPIYPSEDPKSRILRGYCGGIKTEIPRSMFTLGPRPDLRKDHPRPYEGPSLAITIAEDKGSDSVLMMTPQVISLKRKSTKTTKNKGKAAITAIKYSAPDRTMLFILYNHSQPLWVWADWTSINPEHQPTRGHTSGRGS